MSFPKKLTDVLKELESEGRLTAMAVKVESSGIGRFVAIVTSPTFARMRDYNRQELVWGKILEKLSDSEQRLVEFVFTSPPPKEKNSGEPLSKPRKSAKRR